MTQAAHQPDDAKHNERQDTKRDEGAKQSTERCHPDPGVHTAVRHHADAIPAKSVPCLHTTTQ
jgi:hypothetical protein